MNKFFHAVITWISGGKYIHRWEMPDPLEGPWPPILGELQEGQICGVYSYGDDVVPVVWWVEIAYLKGFFGGWLPW